jgi:integrase
MALVKRGKTWHCHFFMDGQRFRQSLETSDWREAQSKQKDLIADAKAGKVSAARNAFARLAFRDAAKQSLDDRAPRLAPLSIRTEKERAKAVNKTFGDIRVSAITPADVLAYIRKRKAANISNATVNRELDIIRGVVKKAKRWHLFADEVSPLPIRHNVGRAMALDEKLRLLRLAASRTEWQNAAWAATLALNTTMRGCEIKSLRWHDVDLLGRTVTIHHSKTEAGERIIPLNASAYEAVLSLYRRAKEIGDVLTDHFVFFSCEHGHVDRNFPQKSWRTAWRNLTRLIACPVCGREQNPAKICCNEKCQADIEAVKSPLAGLRFHDLRHHAITELAESQTSDSTIMAVAGHVSQKMLAHYSHVRLQAKRTALDGLASGSYDTKRDTKREHRTEQVPQVVEKMVELVGIEPTTSSLRTMRSPS